MKQFYAFVCNNWNDTEISRIEIARYFLMILSNLIDAMLTHGKKNQPSKFMKVKIEVDFQKFNHLFEFKQQ